MNAPKHHIIQFACLMAIVAAIVLQGLTHGVKVKPLYNYMNQPVTYNLEKLPLNKETYDGEYQLYLAEKAWQNTGFREFFCRCYNQMAYSCFGMTDNANVVKGKKKELYLLGNLKDVTGELLKSHYESVEEAKTDAQKNVEATLALIDTLQNHGTTFLFVFCPTKPVVYPEYLPDTYKDDLIDFSLADYYIELFKGNNIPHIDFYNHFKAIKDTVRYPLYTRLGSHWAESTMPFVTDSILRKLEEVGGYKLPKVSYIAPNLTRNYSNQDGELEPSLNLLFPLAKPKLPRPEFALTDTLGADRPKLLVVGDGYFVPLLHSRFVDAFAYWDYWMYNRDIYSSRPFYNWKRVSTLFDAAEVLEDADIVLAIYTSNYLFNFMSGFTQSAQELFQKGSTSDQEAIKAIMESIKDNTEWYKAVEQQAKERGITVEENLYRNAEYVLQTEKTKKEQIK